MLQDAFGPGADRSCTLAAKVLDSHLEAPDGALNPGLSQGQKNPLEAVFLVYRSYREHDYEDWEDVDASGSLDVCEKVEARLLQEANRSLNSCQSNSFDNTLYYIEKFMNALSKQALRFRLLWSSLKFQG